jgi:hypothetical protein
LDFLAREFHEANWLNGSPLRPSPLLDSGVLPVFELIFSFLTSDLIIIVVFILAVVSQSIVNVPVFIPED